MIEDRVNEVLTRIGAVWPSKDTSDDTYAEWARFIRPFEVKTAQRAVDSLASTCKWRPSMAEFREAYNVALGNPSGQRMLGDGVQQTIDYSDSFGSAQDDWVYCFACWGAITLEERATTPHYTEGHGMRHANCPRRGTVPTAPSHIRLQYEEKKRAR